MKIKALENYRYSVTGLHNERFRQLLPHPSSVAVSLTMPITYAELTDKHLSRLRLAQASKQILRNHATAIKAWMTSNGKSRTSYVGPELSEVEFPRALEAHIKGIELSKRSAADRKSLLRGLQITFSGLQQGGAFTSPKVDARAVERKAAEFTPLSKAILSACGAAKLRPKHAARLAGISTSAVGRWCRGAIPNVRTRDDLGKLESTLNLASGVLVAALNETLGALEPRHHDPFRQRQSQLIRRTYVMKARDVSPSLLQSWRELVEYKTAVAPIGLKRKPSASWTLVNAKQTNAAATPFNSVRGLVSASASFAWNLTAKFLGFVSLDSAAGGYGHAKGEAQSLAWFAAPEALNAMLSFMSERSGGVRHNGHKAFCSFGISLLQEKTGFLRQQPHLLSELPASAVRGRSWNELCEQATELLKTWKAQANSKSRNPDLGIQYFLEYEWPLSPVIDAMNKLHTIASTTPADSQESLLAKRDRLLLGMLISNPLRLRHWIVLGSKPSAAGDIYRTNQGSWRIRIPGDQFKNRKRVGSDSYNVALPDWLTELVDDYVNNVRPKLLAGQEDTGEFLLSANGKRFNGLSHHLAKLTKRLIPGCGGIRSHAFRHLVATDWLTRFPNDFLTVAELLHDSLEVVLRDYAHLKKDSAFSRYEAHVNRMMDEHKK